MKYLAHCFGIYVYSGKQFFIQDDFGNLVKSHAGALVHLEHYKSVL